MKSTMMFLITISAWLVSCSKSEFELNKSVYQPDPEYPSLPAYTEWGYNTFGAYYERKLFIYTESEVPAKMINRNGITRFVLNGKLTDIDDNNYYYHNDYSSGVVMKLSMELPAFNPVVYTDLIQLNDTTFDLADSEVYAVLLNDTIDMQIIQGSLQFKRVQNLIVDKNPNMVILSGYFGMQALVEDNPISISYGRFDVGIDKYEFVKY